MRFLGLILSTLALSASAVRHVEFRQGHTRVDSDGFHHHSSELHHENKIHSLTYSAKPGDVININEYASISLCTPNVVVAHPLAEASSLLSQFQQGKSVIVGDYSAGCMDTTTGEPIPLMKRVQHVNIENDGSIRLLVKDATYADVFEHAKILYTEQEVRMAPESMAKPLKLAISRESQLIEAKPVLNSSVTTLAVLSSGTIQPMEPWTGTSVNSSNPLLVSWTSSGVSAGTSISIQVKISQTLIDKTIGTWTVNSAGDGQQSTYITVGGDWPSSTDYYVTVNGAKGNTFSVNYLPNAAITTPNSQNAYMIGRDSQFTVNWIADPSQSGYSCTLKIMISKPWVIDTTVQSQSCKMSDMQATISLPSSFSGSWSESSNYYAQISYDCILGLFCKKLYSQFFSVVSTESNLKVAINSPDAQMLTFSGNTLTTTWSSNAADAGVGNIPITVTLRQDSWATSTVWATFSPSLNDGTMSFNVPAGLPAATNYFIQIEWDCNGYHGACKIAQSRRFTINHNPLVTFTAPSFQQVFSPATPVSTSWTWAGASQQSLMVQVEQDPSFSTALFPVYKTSVSNYPTSATVTLPTGYVLPLVWKVYYNCKIAGWFCDFDTSPSFYVSKQIQGSQSGGTVLFSNSAQLPICPVCGSTDVSASLTANYTASVAATVSMFEIYISDFAIVALRYNLSGQIFSSMDLNLKLQQSYTMPIPDIPLYAFGYSPSFSVAGIPIQAGANVGLYLRVSLGASALGTASTGIDGTWNFAVLHQRGTIYPQDISTASVQRQSFNLHAPSVNLVNANAFFRFGPALDASVGLTLFGQGARATADLYIYSELRGKFAYPAMNALTSSTIPRTLIPTIGNCLTPHYIEVNWDVDVNGTFGGVLLSKPYGINNQQLLNEPMAFACMVSASTVSKVASFSMRISNFIFGSAGSLAVKLAGEFASFLHLDPTNVYVNVDNSGVFQVNTLNGDANAAKSLCSALGSGSNGIFVYPYTTIAKLAGQVSVDCSSL